MTCGKVPAGRGTIEKCSGSGHGIFDKKIPDGIGMEGYA